MNDIIKQAYDKLEQKKNIKVNRLQLLKRYLLLKYHLDMSPICLINRVREWAKLHKHYEQ